MSTEKHNDRTADKGKPSIDEIYGNTDPIIIEPEDLADELKREPELFDSPTADEDSLDDQTESGEPKFEGLELEAETLMYILDTGFGMACGAIDRSHDYERYTLKEKRRKELARLLEKVMHKWESRFSAETYFIGLLLVSYTPLLLLAWQRRTSKVKITDATAE